MVAERLLEYNINSISFDFPGHIDSQHGTDKLLVDVCVSYINTVENYVKKEFGNNVGISFYAISYGAYVLLNKLINDNSEYENIILRSPAFNMKDIFVNCLLKEDFETFKKQGKAKSGHGGKIEVSYAFYEDLERHDVFKNYLQKRNILIIQGEQDDTAPITDTYEFINSRPEIELIKMKNMKHHMSEEEIDTVTDVMIEKLGIDKLT